MSLQNFYCFSILLLYGNTKSVNPIFTAKNLRYVNCKVHPSVSESSKADTKTKHLGHVRTGKK